MATAAVAVVSEDKVGERPPIVPHLGELIFGAVVFLALLWVVAKYVVPKLEQAYAERTAAIEGGMAQAEEAQKEAEAAKAQYEAQLADARAEAAQIREDARAQGAQIVAESREQAGTEAARIADSAQKSIEAERQQAAVTLRNDVGRMSTDLAGRIVGESLEDETRQRGIVERFLAELEAGQVTPEKVGGAPSGDATVAGGSPSAGGATPAGAES
ncbi:F0F1 ATP synthase subunit B [Luteipulveratus sp. YIM 133132]|uniref:F0F1 ATP synthase subunit B n=1 Tax=Luteipulveratus flavus TaxID=3031728 RepID=UPI0023AF750A|nr:F0F1 ATP synthase subunit B [Luteipulveratus sp. YIM 133132]MDE9365942.1 F0F1 ATP synthase subunit B [Luteipulveratus sp. YIM 133132]